MLVRPDLFSHLSKNLISFSSAVPHNATALPTVDVPQIIQRVTECMHSVVISIRSLCGGELFLIVYAVYIV